MKPSNLNLLIIFNFCVSSWLFEPTQSRGTCTGSPLAWACDQWRNPNACYDRLNFCVWDIGIDQTNNTDKAKGGCVLAIDSCADVHGDEAWCQAIYGCEWKDDWFGPAIVLVIMFILWVTMCMWLKMG